MLERADRAQARRRPRTRPRSRWAARARPPTSSNNAGKAIEKHDHARDRQDSTKRSPRRSRTRCSSSSICSRSIRKSMGALLREVDNDSLIDALKGIEDEEREVLLPRHVEPRRRRRQGRDRGARPDQARRCGRGAEADRRAPPAAWPPTARSPSAREATTNMSEAVRRSTAAAADRPASAANCALRARPQRAGARGAAAASRRAIPTTRSRRPPTCEGHRRRLRGDAQPQAEPNGHAIEAEAREALARSSFARLDDELAGRAAAAAARHRRGAVRSARSHRWRSTRTRCCAGSRRPFRCSRAPTTNASSVCIPTMCALVAPQLAGRMAGRARCRARARRLARRDPATAASRTARPNGARAIAEALRTNAEAVRADPDRSGRGRRSR